MVSEDLETSMEMHLPGAGKCCRKLRRRTKERLRQCQNPHLVFSYERHCRAQATQLFRATGVLCAFNLDQESESAFFGGLRAALCMICGGPHASEQHDTQSTGAARA